VKVVDRDASGEWDVPLQYEKLSAYSAAQTRIEVLHSEYVANQPKFQYEHLELAA